MKWIVPWFVLCLACSSPPSSPAVDSGPSSDLVSDTSVPPDASSLVWSEGCPQDEVEFRTIDVGEVSLNVACRGSGPTLVLLHGFPEFWYGWSAVMDRLASKYRLIVPDQRGVNVSEKPDGVANYQIAHLVTDIAGLIDAVSTDPVIVVGHDWGGVVAWVVASQVPDKVEKLVIMNAPHPDVFAREYAENPDQQDASFYIGLLIADSSEEVLSANDYAFLVGAMGGGLSDTDLERYKEAWAQPGALTGMVNWYRANFTDEGPAVPQSVHVSVPTLVLWGLADTALLAGNIEGLEDYVPDLTLKTFEGVSHWIAHEIPDEVAAAIDAFVQPSP
jgi:pimeloyl-ACP methyl ester carboxylesterase